MPPRYAYWTIIVDNQPTAFRSGSQEELMPTFKRLKAKNDTAVMMWFQIGKLWPSRIDAQEFMRARGETGRKGDDRQPARRSLDRERKPAVERSERTAWTPRGEPSTPPPARNADDKLDWKPKGDFVPAPKRAERPERPDWKPKGASDRESRPDWKSKPSSPSTYAKAPADRQAFKPSRSEKPEWKPKGSFDRERKPSARSFDREERPRAFKRPDFKSSGDDTRSAKPEWKPKGSFDRESKPDWKSKPSSPRAFKPSHSEKPAWKPKGSFDRERKPEWRPNRDSGGRFSSSEGARVPRGEKLDWKPKVEGEKRKWVPKEEYKKSMGIEAKRDSKWRPGGEHKDPRQKYKDAKKAKWSKFKKAIRTRSEGKKNKP